MKQLEKDNNELKRLLLKLKSSFSQLKEQRYLKIETIQDVFVHCLNTCCLVIISAIENDQFDQEVVLLKGQLDKVKKDNQRLISSQSAQQSNATREL